MDADLRAFLTEKFEVIDQHFEAIDHRFQASDQRSATLEQKIDETRRELRLHFDVTAESFRGEIRLIAEQHGALDRRIDDLRLENRREHQETRGWLRSSYPDLDRRVIRLEERVDRLEQQGS